MKKHHPILNSILLFLFGVLMGLTIVETGLRVAGYSAPVFREPNTRLGWRGTANLKGSHRIENVTFNTFNSKGYHDREHYKAKKDGTLRIAIVGDSFVQASEVTLNDHFASIMEKMLNERLAALHRQVEIINFGVSGYSTAQELILLRTEIREYQPDIVVLVVYPGNDIIDNSYELATTLRNSRPYFVKDKKHSLSRKPGYPDPDKILKQTIIVKLINASRLLQLTKEAVKQWRLRSITELRQEGKEKGPEDDVFLDQHSGPWEEAWDLTETLIAEFAKETTAAGAHFFMAIAAVPIQVHPVEAERIQFMTLLNLKTLSYPNLRLSEFARRSGIPYISLVKPFFDRSRTGVYLHGFDKNSFGKGHWNPKGHRLVAELLTERLFENYLAQGPGKKWAK